MHINRFLERGNRISAAIVSKGMHYSSEDSTDMVLLIESRLGDVRIEWRMHEKSEDARDGI